MAIFARISRFLRKRALLLSLGLLSLSIVHEAAMANEPGYCEKANMEEIAATVGSGDLQLDGTLTLPQGSGPFPAVILVHGSGPHDRDETVANVKIFKDIACGLAARDIAVLRYEKRTRQHGDIYRNMENYNKLTINEETVDDALLAVATLQANSKIDARHIYILGHSLGGMVIPRIADRNNVAAGFIIMAGNARPLEDLLLEQIENLMADKEKEVREKNLAALHRQIALVKDDKLTVKTEAKLLPLSLPASYWLDLRGYKPAEMARTITRPLLILQGARDKQVTMTDFQQWWDALNDKSTATFKVYNSLNHFFIEGDPTATPPAHVEEQVIKDIAKWIVEQEHK
jgi:dienelactone hydrolase